MWERNCESVKATKFQSQHKHIFTLLITDIAASTGLRTHSLSRMSAWQGSPRRYEAGGDDAALNVMSQDRRLSIYSEDAQVDARHSSLSSSSSDPCCDPGSSGVGGCTAGPAESPIENQLEGGLPPPQ